MHPLAAPGTLWVLSRVGKYLVRPQADETSHKEQVPCGWQGKRGSLLFSVSQGFASAEATKGLSARPLETFGAHLLMRIGFSTRNGFLVDGKEKGLLAFSVSQGFASAEATKGLSGRPLETFGVATGLQTLLLAAAFEISR